jgi:hypothetical protein
MSGKSRQIREVTGLRANDPRGAWGICCKLQSSRSENLSKYDPNHPDNLRPDVNASVVIGPPRILSRLVSHLWQKDHGYNAAPQSAIEPLPEALNTMRKQKASLDRRLGQVARGHEAQ